MSLSIYSRIKSPAFAAARAMLVANLVRDGGWGGWCLDPGRLEDGLGETMLASPILGSGGTLICKFAPSGTCSHGLQGIFGHYFVKALEASGRTLVVEIDYDAKGSDVFMTDFRFVLV